MAVAHSCFEISYFYRPLLRIKRETLIISCAGVLFGFWQTYIFNEIVQKPVWPVPFPVHAYDTISAAV